MFVILGLVWETDTLDSCKSFGGSHAIDHDSGKSGEEVCEPTDDLKRLVFVVCGKVSTQPRAGKYTTMG
jgi:hypothetical protein